METNSQISLTSFCRAYLICALWSSTDDNENPFDANYGINNLAPEALQKAVDDCAKFETENTNDLELACLDSDRAGHCFWLNRNGHGSGFWDEYPAHNSIPYNEAQRIAMAESDLVKRTELFKRRDALKLTENDPYHACERLSDSSVKFKECYMYLGDDGKIYID